eukprot:COSAG05_NODE_2263_length_3315_cov_742.343177_3_plen_303_part_00
MAVSAVTPPCFFVSVRGAPRCSVEAQQRAAAETEAVLSALLPRQQQQQQQQQLLQPSHPPPEQGTTGFSKVDVAHRGAFVMQLPPPTSMPPPCTPPSHRLLQPERPRKRSSHRSSSRPSSYRFRAFLLAKTRAWLGCQLAYARCSQPILFRPVSYCDGPAPARQLALAGVRIHPCGFRLVAGSSIAIMVQLRGDDANGATNRGGAMVERIAARDAALQVVATEHGCSVDLVKPTNVVILTSWRELKSEQPLLGVAIVPGHTVVTQPRMMPIKLPARPKPAGYAHLRLCRRSTTHSLTQWHLI